MPMITPAYPASNSSYTVSEFTLDIMKMELQRGYDLLQQVFKDKSEVSIDILFEPSDFFIKYNHYLALNIIGVGTDETSRSWMGYCESRIRFILKYLAYLPIKPLHFYPVKSKTTVSANSICYFIGFNIDTVKFRGELKELNFAKGWIQFKDGLISKYDGKTCEGLDFTVTHYTYKELFKSIPEVFEMYGGREIAKTMRKERRAVMKSSEPVVKTSTQITPIKEAVVTAENELPESKVTEEDISTVDMKKRSREDSDTKEQTSSEAKRSKLSTTPKVSFLPPAYIPLKAFQSISTVTWNLLPQVSDLGKKK